MRPELWRQAEELFHEALDRPPDERRAFLDSACGGDRELARLVDTLIAGDAQAGAFLEPPSVDSTASQGARGLLVGRQLGPYRIVSFLGGGGMGEVYRAHDGKLGRDVAIKTLPPEFARDPERLARFRREARALASLNHPNIAAIYGLEEAAGTDYLVLELVEGDTLRGPLPVAKALDVAAQVAEALAAAHRHGIVHRDLKPANLKMTPEGRVKVLDFGLAKTARVPDVEPDAAAPPPPGGAVTATGRVLGTPGYMSPEQARGAEVDQRTDIWAFGCVVYELLAGKRAFAGRTAQDVLAAAVDREPDWQALPGATPAKVRDLLRRCLEKDEAHRLDDIAVVTATVDDVWRGRSRAPRRAGAARSRERRPAGRIRALAVLPLSNLTRDPEQDYFADGMTDALIAELAQIRALRVISRTSAMHYKATTRTVPEIARELSVDAIVEGSVMRAGERVRITAQLVNAASDTHIWAHSYERDVRDVLQLQREVAQAIADEIQVTLTPQERARLSRVRQVDVEAHEAYVRGHYHWGRGQPDKAIEHFRRAIALDPDHAQAYAGIADAQCMLFGAVLQAIPPSEIAPAARTAALKAMKLDDTLAEPHVTLARVGFWHDRDPVGAERELRQAIRLNPNCAMAHFHHGILLADLKRGDEAVAAFGRASQLDPVSCWNSTITGWCLYELGKEEQGRQQLQKAIELDPNLFFPRSALSIIGCYEGRFAEAVADAQEGVRLSAGLPLARGWAAYVLARAGRKADAAVILDALDALSRERHVSAYARIWGYLGLGDYERTIEWLEKGYQERDSGLPHVGMFRAFKPLEADPRFHDLLRRLGVAS